MAEAADLRERRPVGRRRRSCESLPASCEDASLTSSFSLEACLLLGREVRETESWEERDEEEGVGEIRAAFFLGGMGRGGVVEGGREGEVYRKGWWRRRGGEEEERRGEESCLIVRNEETNEVGVVSGFVVGSALVEERQIERGERVQTGLRRSSF